MAGKSRFSRQNWMRGVSYLKRNGLKQTYYKARERLVRDAEEENYDVLSRAERPSAEELERQRRERFKHMPKISILVPAYETPEKFFAGMVRSVLRQSYVNWELCIADGSRTDQVENMVGTFLIRGAEGGQEAVRDGRIRYLRLERNAGISENTNAALSMAAGDYVGLLDHDDLLREDALYEAVKALNQGAGAVYTDEDKIDETESRYFDVHRKPDFNKDLLLSNNYICHFFVTERELALRIGGFSPGFDGAQDYDFILRCVEELEREKKKIAHIPKVLYHWRSHPASTAEHPESKMYAYDAGKKALAAYFKRNGIPAVPEHTAHLGFYRIRYDGREAGVREEDVLVSAAPSLKPLQSGWEEEMRGYFCRPEVAVVGGKIYDRKHRIVCAGYERGEDGTVRSCFEGMNGHYSGYIHRASLQRETEAVDINCMMVRRSVYEELGGNLEETGRKGLEVSYEFCRRVREAGYLVVFDPYAEFQVI